MPDKPPKRCTSSCGDSREDSDRHTHVEGCRFAGREFPQYTASQVAAEKKKVWERAIQVADDWANDRMDKVLIG